MPTPQTYVAFLLAVAICAASLPALAATTHTKKPAPAPGPHAIGTFQDWTAAVNREGGQTVCYAFTRAHGSNPKVNGRGDVVLTVTQRPALRDAVAISAGFAFAPNASVKVVAGTSNFDFYTAERSAFARDGHAVVEAMQRAHQVVAVSPTAKDAQVTDTFALAGFGKAYAAIVKHCPAGKPG
jgi:hypothetical protein